MNKYIEACLECEYACDYTAKNPGNITIRQFPDCKDIQNKEKRYQCYFINCVNLRCTNECQENSTE